MASARSASKSTLRLNVSVLCHLMKMRTQNLPVLEGLNPIASYLFVVNVSINVFVNSARQLRSKGVPLLWNCSKVSDMSCYSAFVSLCLQRRPSLCCSSDRSVHSRLFAQCKDDIETLCSSEIWTSVRSPILYSVTAASSRRCLSDRVRTGPGDRRHVEEGTVLVVRIVGVG